MQDIIYYAGILGLGQQVLKDFISGVLEVKLSDNGIDITYNGNKFDIPVQNPELFGEVPVYKFLPNIFNNIGTNIEREYDNLIRQKEFAIADVINKVYHQQLSAGHHVPESNGDAVVVFDADASHTPLQLNDSSKYDLVALKFNNNLYQSV